jgi:hypothetical protein
MENKKERFDGGPKPLLFGTLPEMPFWEVLVPFPAEPVEDVGRNPLRSTIPLGKAIGEECQGKADMP